MNNLFNSAAYWGCFQENPIFESHFDDNVYGTDQF